MKEYDVLREGWIGGKPVEAGGKITLSDAAAEYHVLSGLIAESNPKAAKPAAKPAAKE